MPAIFIILFFLVVIFMILVITGFLGFLFVFIIKNVASQRKELLNVTESEYREEFLKDLREIPPLSSESISNIAEIQGLSHIKWSYSMNAFAESSYAIGLESSPYVFVKGYSVGPSKGLILFNVGNISCKVLIESDRKISFFARESKIGGTIMPSIFKDNSEVNNIYDDKGTLRFSVKKSFFTVPGSVFEICSISGEKVASISIGGYLNSYINSEAFRIEILDKAISEEDRLLIIGYALLYKTFFMRSYKRRRDLYR